MVLIFLMIGLLINYIMQGFLPVYQKKINLSTQIISEVNISSLPVFMNNSHKAIYYRITDSSYIYYLYDFSTDSTKQIYESITKKELLKTNNFWPWFSISPDDSKFLLHNALNLEDSTWLYLPDSVVYHGAGLEQVWSSDTSFILFSLNNALAEYNFTTGKVDTLVTKNERILNFAYNIKNGLLAYSTGDYNEQDYVFVYDKNTEIEKFIYGPSIDSIYCGMGTQEINDLAWSPDGNNLVFLSYDYTNPGTGIDIYNVLEDKVIKITECVGVGLKKNVIWTSNDTIIYAYGNNLDQVYGFDLQNILTSVNLNSPQNYKLTLSNYPNPLNPSTIIKYSVSNYTHPSIPSREGKERSDRSVFVTLNIYDILGHEITTLVNEKQKAGIYEITWNGKNSNYQKISSGIYLARLVVNNKGSINHKSIKLLFLK